MPALQGLPSPVAGLRSSNGGGIGHPPGGSGKGDTGFDDDEIKSFKRIYLVHDPSLKSNLKRPSDSGGGGRASSEGSPQRTATLRTAEGDATWIASMADGEESSRQIAVEAARTVFASDQFEELSDDATINNQDRQTRNRNPGLTNNAWFGCREGTCALKSRIWRRADNYWQHLKQVHKISVDDLL